MIMRCTCEHEFQDRLHGKYMRVFNPLKRSATHSNHARCTVCGTIKQMGESKIDKIDKTGNTSKLSDSKTK